MGASGHGPEWLRLSRALEKAASEYLGLGNLELSWRYSVYRELTIVKRLIERTVGFWASKVEEVDNYFGKLISDMEALLGSMA